MGPWLLAQGWVESCRQPSRQPILHNILSYHEYFSLSRLCSHSSGSKNFQELITRPQKNIGCPCHHGAVGKAEREGGMWSQCSHSAHAGPRPLLLAFLQTETGG